MIEKYSLDKKVKMIFYVDFWSLHQDNNFEIGYHKIILN